MKPRGPFGWPNGVTSGFNINGLTADSVAALADLLPYYKTSAGGPRRLTIQQAFDLINLLSGFTTPLLTDAVPVYDSAGSAAKKTTLQQLFDRFTALNQVASPSPTNDFLPLYSASLTSARKATPQDLVRVAGGNVLLATLTASGSASLDFTATNSTKYAGYLCVIDQYLPATDNTDWHWRVSTDGGANFLAGTGYSHARFGTTVAPATGNGGAAGAAFVLLNNGLANTATAGWSGVLYVAAGAGANDWKISGVVSGFSTGPVYLTVFTGGLNNSTGINAFQFKQSSGNVASGTIRVYGVPK